MKRQSKELPQKETEREDSKSELSGIPYGLSVTMSESGSIITRASETTGGPDGIISEPGGIMSGPSGIMSGSSGNTIPEGRTPSSQLSRPNVGVIPRSSLLDFLQGEPNTVVQTYPDGMVTNIPPTMMTDQYGMIGYLSAYRGIHANPSIGKLMIGEDPVNMGLGMNSRLIVPDPSGHGRREIHLNYGGPWAGRSNHAPRIESRVPEVYGRNPLVGDNLPPIKFPMLQEDVLFYIFYNFPGEQYQIAAAYELHGREWRYHKVDCVWIKRLSSDSVTERTTTFERGVYNVFDTVHWRMLQKAMTLQYEDLAERPEIPPDMQLFFNL